MKNLKLLDGIYYGWAKILNDPARENNVYMMSASIGNNPTYGNPNRFCSERFTAFPFVSKPLG